MKAVTTPMPSRWDQFTEVIEADRNVGENLTEGEVYFWAEHKRRENLDHIASGHDKIYGMCRSCGNCKCDFKRFRCICASGKTFVTPYKIRSRF